MPFLKPYFPKDFNLNSSETTKLHHKIIISKPELKFWYKKQYRKYISLISAKRDGRHIELGSGGGFIKELMTEIMTSSILKSDAENGYCDICADAQAMPFDDISADSFFMLDVLHHLNNPRSFFTELQRCLKKGGFALIIEPANTVFSRLLYKNFHHENFNENTANWECEHSGNLSDANQAMASVIFERDRNIFGSDFPNLEIKSIKKHTFISYILSGGLSYKPLIPHILWPAAIASEYIFTPLNKWLGTYMDILIVKN